MDGGRGLRAGDKGRTSRCYWRGDTDLADRYGLELLRFYEHYRFRYYVRELGLKKVGPLKEDDSWANDYYTPGHLKESARLRFSGR